MSTAALNRTDAYVADTLAEWASDFAVDHASGEVHHEAKRCILDVIGVAYAGAAHPTAVLTRGQVLAQYGAGPSSLFGDAVRVSSTGAALANGTAAHAWDYDDVSLEGMVHGSAAVWPAVLAAAESNGSNGSSGADLLSAFIAGVEAEYALGRAFTHDLFFRGWWTTGLLGAIGAIGAAIGAGRAMGLDTRILAQAVRIAAAQATGPYVLVGTPIKPYACGRAAEAGVQAANFARAGLTAPDDVFEKRYPACAGALGSVEAVLDLRSAHQLTADQVSRIRCEVTPAIGHYMQYRVPRDTTEAQFSLPYCVACALRFGSLTFDHLTDAAIRDRDTLRVLEAIEIVTSDELAQQEEEREDHVEPAIATIWTHDGRELRTLNPAATGTPQRPISDAELEDKFLGCTDACLELEDAKNLIARIWKLETIPSALELLPSTR